MFRHALGMMRDVLSAFVTKKRDYEEIFSYPRDADLVGIPGYRYMCSLVRRSGIAHRLCYGIPRSCYRQGFNLIGEGGERLESDALNTLINDCELLTKIERADILNRIGSFSCLFVGVPDGITDLTQPIGKFSADKLDQVYFVPFQYSDVIIHYENELASDRYGKAKSYQLTTDSGTDYGKPVRSFDVHHSRVIHFSEQALTNEYEGESYLTPIVNTLLDILKIVGGNAEAFFRNANPKIVFETSDGYTQDDEDENAEETRKKIEDFTNEFRNYIKLTGQTAKHLPVSLANPLDSFGVCIAQVIAYTGLPARLLLHDTSGQYGASEDRITYNSLIANRQAAFCGPKIMEIIRLLDSLCGLGLPTNKLAIEFPEVQAFSETEAENVRDKRVGALDKMVKLLRSEGAEFDLQKVIEAFDIAGVEVQQAEFLESEFLDESEEVG